MGISSSIKLLFLNGCTNTSPLILKLEDDNTTKLHDYTVLLVDFVGSVGPKIVGKYVRRPCLVLAVFSLIFHRSNYFRIIVAIVEHQTGFIIGVKFLPKIGRPV